MSQPARPFTTFLPERLREGLGRRAAGITIAILIELLLILVLITLGISGDKAEEPTITISTFDAGSTEEEPAPEETETAIEETSPEEPQPDETPPQQPEPQPQPQPRPVPPAPEPAPQPVPQRPSLITLPQGQMPPDIASLPGGSSPAPPSAPVYGPPSTPRAGDSRRVGTAPDGKPLYAAAWYREPYESELAGYLSTAQGPGWGLIACKTAAEYRVENCVALDESPNRSGIARAVLAAAWQFQVRPPRVNGKAVYGEWVRIRIDYGIRR